MVVTDRGRVLEALGSPGKVLLVEVVPPEGAHRPRASPLAQLPSLPVKLRLPVDVPQHAEHPRVFLLLLHEPGEHLEGLLLVVLLNEDVDALLLEPCLREQLNRRHAEPQLHVPVRQDQDVPEMRLVGRGIEGLSGLAYPPVENQSQFLELVQRTFRVLYPGELVQRTQKKQGVAIAERGGNLVFEHSGDRRGDVLIQHLVVGRRTPLEMENRQSYQKVVLTDLALALLSLGLF